MTLEGVLLLLLWIVVIFALGWLAHWVISTFLPEPVRTPAMLVVGVILLIVVVLVLLQVSGIGKGRLGQRSLPEVVAQT